MHSHKGNPEEKGGNSGEGGSADGRYYFLVRGMAPRGEVMGLVYRYCKPRSVAMDGMAQRSVGDLSGDGTATIDYRWVYGDMDQESARLEVGW